MAILLAGQDVRRDRQYSRNVRLRGFKVPPAAMARMPIVFASRLPRRATGALSYNYVRAWTCRRHITAAAARRIAVAWHRFGGNVVELIAAGGIEPGVETFHGRLGEAANDIQGEATRESDLLL